MKYLFSLLMLVSAYSVCGQQYFMHSMYLKNRYALNPAAAGLDTRWVLATQGGMFSNGGSNAPQHAQFQINGALSGNTGVGLQAKSFWNGVFQTSLVQTSAAYRAYFQEDHFLSLGLSAGFGWRSLDMSQVSNGMVDLTDPLLNSGYLNKSGFRFDAGALYKYKNLEVSLTFPQLYEISQRISPSFVGVMSYRMKANNLTISPFFMWSRYQWQPAWADLGAMIEWKETIWMQANYRSNQSIGVAVGVKLKEISLGYSYNQPTGNLANLYANGHDILLSFPLSSFKAKQSPVE